MLDAAVKEETITLKMVVRILEIRENVSSGNDADFRNLLNEHSGEGCSPRVILDLSRMRFINSSGLGAIAGMSMRLRKLSGRLVIVSPHRELTQVFTVTKLDQVLTIVTDLTTAIAFFAQADA